MGNYLNTPIGGMLAIIFIFSPAILFAFAVDYGLRKREQVNKGIYKANWFDKNLENIITAIATASTLMVIVYLINHYIQN